MNTTLSTFMKVAITVVVISSLIFYVGFKMLDDESIEYQDVIDTNLNDVFDDNP